MSQTKYETIFVLDPSLPEEETEAVTEKFKTLISDNGELESCDIWGKRRLAYPINYKQEGFYVFIRFSSGQSFPKELERIYRITESVMRNIIVKREE